MKERNNKRHAAGFRWLMAVVLLLLPLMMKAYRKHRGIDDDEPPDTSINGLVVTVVAIIVGYILKLWYDWRDGKFKKKRK